MLKEFYIPDKMSDIFTIKIWIPDIFCFLETLFIKEEHLNVVQAVSQLCFRDAQTYLGDTGTLFYTTTLCVR